MVILTLAPSESENQWLLYAGALAFMTGVLALPVYLSQRIGDPASNLYIRPPAPLSLVVAWATLAALAV